MSSPPTLGRPRLVEQLRNLIARDGPVTFERFMELSLYEPGLGYYASLPIDHAGAPGALADYQTSPQVHPIFGFLLSRELLQIWASLDRPKPFVVVEPGAGDGELARQILDGLRGAAPGLEVRYHAVDARSATASVGSRGGLTCWRDLATLASSVGGVHAVISNEFFDALPVHRLARIGGALREIYVDWNGGGFFERLGNLSDPRLPALIAHRVGAREEGWRGEVCSRLERTLARIGSIVDHGVVVTIDYGYEAGDRTGAAGETVVAYHRHQWNDDLYRRVGEQDLTSHLDVAAFLDLGRRAGLEPIDVTTQREFLLGLGFATEAERWAAREPTPGRQWQARFAMAALVDARGLGRLKVVKQKR